MVQRRFRCSCAVMQILRCRAGASIDVQRRCKGGAGVKVVQVQRHKGVEMQVQLCSGSGANFEVQ